VLDSWLRSYEPERLFGEDGAPQPSLLRFVPQGSRRMGMNPHANGGLLLKDLVLPDFPDYALEVPLPGQTQARTPG
jgi:xylulose-5-phosphate/fructose-6-phosphate phosphoketolase